MVNILLFSESRYPVNRQAVRKLIADKLKEKGIVSQVELSIAIVGDRKMASLNKKYRDKEGTADVLSFSQQEGTAAVQTEDVLRLGDIVISYPQAVKNAAKKEVLVDEELAHLLKHGLEHLLGEHHEE